MANLFSLLIEAVGILVWEWVCWPLNFTTSLTRDVQSGKTTEIGAACSLHSCLRCLSSVPRRKFLTSKSACGTVGPEERAVPNHYTREVPEVSDAQREELEG
ncbi:MAG: hypothetical protein OXF93_14125, partial [Acidobacteria bacterium]|nr:hypothetical protein [Acidobacteriota bacterium]